MRALLLAVLATAAAACYVPAQRGTQTSYPSSTTAQGGGASVGGVGQTTQPVATPTGIAITSSSAALVPVARREPVAYTLNERSVYLVDPITHTCALIFVNHITVPVDCAELKAGLPQVAYLIDWIPAAAPAPVPPSAAPAAAAR